MIQQNTEEDKQPHGFNGQLWPYHYGAYLTGSVNTDAITSEYGKTFNSHVYMAEHLRIPEPSAPDLFKEP